MDESPFLCLLEDDGPIANIDIKTAHRLEPAAQDPDEVVLPLRARTGATDVVCGQLGVSVVLGEAPHARLL